MLPALCPCASTKEPVGELLFRVGEEWCAMRIGQVRSKSRRKATRIGPLSCLLIDADKDPASGPINRDKQIPARG